MSYWQDFPWALVQLIDTEVDKEVAAEVARRWDGMSSCCVRPGLGRELKKLGIPGHMLATEPKWRALLTGYARLL